MNYHGDPWANVWNKYHLTQRTPRDCRGNIRATTLPPGRIASTSRYSCRHSGGDAVTKAAKSRPLFQPTSSIMNMAIQRSCCRFVASDVRLPTPARIRFIPSYRLRSSEARHCAVVWSGPSRLTGAATSNTRRKMAAYNAGLPDMDSDPWIVLDAQHRDTRSVGGLTISIVATENAMCSNTSGGMVSSVGGVAGLGDWVSVMLLSAYDDPCDRDVMLPGDHGPGAKR